MPKEAQAFADIAAVAAVAEDVKTKSLQQRIVAEGEIQVRYPNPRGQHCHPKMTEADELHPSRWK
jgi:hypothetical protein